MGRSLPQEFEISQGEYAGRPSTLFLQVGSDRAIRVSGEVIELGLWHDHAIALLQACVVANDLCG
jgi:predicted PhzF superfamily epimerase YddE/YHI9